MTLLAWRHARVTDKRDLEAFTCARPPGRVPGHPWKTYDAAPWETVVQKGIHVLNPSPSPSAAVLLGRDPEGLAAVCVIGLDYTFGPSLAVFEGVAVALRCRGRGGHFADEAIEEGLQWAIERADLAGLSETRVSGLVDPGNRASREMVKRHGFALIETRTDPDVEEWGAVIRL